MLKRILSRILLGSEEDVAFSRAILRGREALRRDLDAYLAGGQPQDLDGAGAFLKNSLEAARDLATAQKASGAKSWEVDLTRELMVEAEFEKARRRAARRARHGKSAPRRLGI